jgi:AcrR family transcriptional regulator
MSRTKSSEKLRAVSAPAKAPRRPGRPAGRTQRDGLIADRETLLLAAERLIRREGSVSLAAIAAEAGVTKPTLYRGVGDRRALVQALAARLNQRMAENVGRLMAAASGPHERIRCLVHGYLQHAEAERNLYVYINVNGMGEDPVGQSLLLADGTARQFARNIASFRSADGADPSVATTWSYALIGALHYVTLWWLRNPVDDLDTLADRFTEMLWSGFRPERPASADGSAPRKARRRR